MNAGFQSPPFQPPPYPMQPRMEQEEGLQEGGVLPVGIEDATVPLYRASQSKLYTLVSSQSDTYSVIFYNHESERPQNVAASHFGEFAAEPGHCGDFEFFMDEHTKYLSSLGSLFDTEFNDPDPEAEEYVTVPQDTPSTIPTDGDYFMADSGFSRATNNRRSRVARLKPSPTVRYWWFKTRGLDVPRSEWNKMKANKTVLFFNEHEESFMFRAPPVPPMVYLSNQDKNTEEFCRKIQNDLGAASHAILSGNELSVRLRKEIDEFKDRFTNDDKIVPTSDDFLSFFNSISDFLEEGLQRRFGNALRINAAAFNKITTFRRDMVARAQPRFRRALDSGVVPPSERDLFGKMALAAFEEKTANNDVSVPSASKSSSSTGYSKFNKSNKTGNKWQKSDTRSSSSSSASQKGGSNKGGYRNNNQKGQQKGQGQGSSSYFKKGANKQPPRQ